MFAGAAREVVFSNPEVVRRVNEAFIPVALKAALVNNPPPGVEGAVYAEIGRSKPAPQGICTTNSAGKVLAWALSFDDDKSILEFLDHVSDRYRQSPDAANPVTAERFMNFPSRKLRDVEDTGKRISVPERHANDDRCPAIPTIERGTLVGRIIGRALDEDGQPVADTIRQEHYMEARFEVPVVLQEQLAAAVNQAAGKQFQIPSEFARGLITHAFLGQLDVNPMGSVPGSRNDSRQWEFTGQTVPSNLSTESDARHLMAGHPIDLTCNVRYGLVAETGSPDEIVEGAGADVTLPGPGTLPAKIQRLQLGIQRLQKSGGDPSEIAKLMKNFGPLMQKQQVNQAESLVDQALKLLEEPDQEKQDR